MPQTTPTNHSLNTKILELDSATRCLNGIIENISQGILFISFDGVVTTYNPAAEKILKMPKKKVLLQSFWDVFSDDFFGFSLHNALVNTEAPSFFFRSFSPSEGLLSELEISTTFLDQGLIVLIRDITEERRLQALANRHDRMEELGEIAAAVAHEIRNPLGGISGFAALLQRDLKDFPEMQKLAGFIVEGSQTLNRLVGDILHYARPIQMQLETKELYPLIQEVCQLVEADSKLSKNVRYRVDAPSEPLAAYVDPHIFKTALLNLLVNAVQAMPEGGVVTLLLTREKESVVIAVSDTGHGIDPENIKKIFSPFFTTKKEGNGLGLTEVHKIVRAHGGTIDVTSSLGKGSTFTLKLKSAG